jgi:tight adherence protein C
MLLLFLFTPRLTFLFGLVIFFVPDLFLYIQMKLRQQEIIRSLPNILDLMVLCVEAGLSLDATLIRIAKQGMSSNPLTDELALVGNDILFGMKREQVYSELFYRTGVVELRMLGAALNQCSRGGLSIVNVLRAQSQFVRTAAFKKAETRAVKMPIWMSFPLCFLILPAVLIMLVGPAFVQYGITTGGHPRHHHHHQLFPF